MKRSAQVLQHAHITPETRMHAGCCCTCFAYVQLLDAMRDVVVQCKRGVRCAPPTLDNYAYVERSTTQEQSFMFCGLHRMQLVCKDCAPGQWMNTELTGGLKARQYTTHGVVTQPPHHKTRQN